MWKSVTLSAGLLAIVVLAAGRADAGAHGGPKGGMYVVQAESKDVFHIIFRAGECARVTADGDGTSDLDMYVYDEYGDLVAVDDDSTDYCVTTWRPAETGVYRIVIRNLGDIWNQYDLETN